TGCPLRDAYVLNFSNQTTNVTDDNAPSWRSVMPCQMPRFGATLAKTPGDAYWNKFIVFGGMGSPFDGNGQLGELGLIDTDAVSTGSMDIVQLGEGSI